MLAFLLCCFAFACLDDTEALDLVVTTSRYVVVVASAYVHAGACSVLSGIFAFRRFCLALASVHLFASSFFLYRHSFVSLCLSFSLVSFVSRCVSSFVLSMSLRFVVCFCVVCFIQMVESVQLYAISGFGPVVDSDVRSAVFVVTRAPKLTEYQNI